MPTSMLMTSPACCARLRRVGSASTACGCYCRRCVAPALRQPVLTTRPPLPHLGRAPSAQPPAARVRPHPHHPNRCLDPAQRRLVARRRDEQQCKPTDSSSHLCSLLGVAQLGKERLRGRVLTIVREHGHNAPSVHAWAGPSCQTPPPAPSNPRPPLPGHPLTAPDGVLAAAQVLADGLAHSVQNDPCKPCIAV